MHLIILKIYYKNHSIPLPVSVAATTTIIRDVHLVGL
jgi:hypothetical protein